MVDDDGHAGCRVPGSIMAATSAIGRDISIYKPISTYANLYKYVEIYYTDTLLLFFYLQNLNIYKSVSMKRLFNKM